jgi:hypothetical protein
MKISDIESIIEKYVDEETKSIPISYIHAISVEIAQQIIKEEKDG